MPTRFRRIRHTYVSCSYCLARDYILTRSLIDQPFATSGFEQHAVIGTIGVVTNLISGTAKPFIGKVRPLSTACLFTH